MSYKRDMREARFGGGGPHQGAIVVRCTKCMEVTKLYARTTTSLEADGHLCGGWEGT